MDQSNVQDRVLQGPADDPPDLDVPPSCECAGACAVVSRRVRSRAAARYCRPVAHRWRCSRRKQCEESCVCETLAHRSGWVHPGVYPLPQEHNTRVELRKKVTWL